VINFNRFNFKTVSIKKVPIQEYINLIAFFLDYIIENMMLPGKVENWVVITDFEKSGLSDLGFGSVKQVMGVLTDYYRCRLGCNYVVNPSKTVYYLWTCLRPFLDDIVIEKVKILNKATPDEIFLHCNKYQVEEKYGGKAKNVEKFWPPFMPRAPYDLNGEISKEKSFEGNMEEEKGNNQEDFQINQFDEHTQKDLNCKKKKRKKEEKKFGEKKIQLESCDEKFELNQELEFDKRLEIREKFNGSEGSVNDEDEESKERKRIEKKIRRKRRKKEKREREKFLDENFKDDGENIRDNSTELLMVKRNDVETAYESDVNIDIIKINSCKDIEIENSKKETLCEMLCLSKEINTSKCLTF
jgi:urease beta subunit